MVTKIYREAIDTYWKDRENYLYNSEWEKELSKTSNRDFTTGFFNGKAGNDISTSSNAIQTYDFLGIVKEALSQNRALVDIRNKFISGDDVEWVGKRGKPASLKIDSILDSEGVRKKEVVQPNEEVIIKFDAPVEKYDILRKKRNEGYPYKMPDS
jgi:putative protease